MNSHAGPGLPRTLAGVLEPDVLDALCIAISTLPREAATIAANHARLVADGVLDLRSTDRAHRPEDEARRFFPLQTAQRAELVFEYGEATRVSEITATSLAPNSRGYHALKARALIRPTLYAMGPSVDRARQHGHQGQRQQTDGGRPVTPKP